MMKEINFLQQLDSAGSPEKGDITGSTPEAAAQPLFLNTKGNVHSECRKGGSERAQ